MERELTTHSLQAFAPEPPQSLATFKLTEYGFHHALSFQVTLTNFRLFHLVAQHFLRRIFRIAFDAAPLDTFCTATALFAPLTRRGAILHVTGIPLTPFVFR